MSVTPHLNDIPLDDLDHGAHVWFCDPDAALPTADLERCRDLLSADERVRAARFMFEADQQRFVLSHAMLRIALSRYIDVAPVDWCFIINAHGKPELADAHSRYGLHFNLTHTEGLCACVVTRHIDCGIDVEFERRDNQLQPIAQKMFAEQELATMPDDARTMRELFFRYWTLREAYVKALGTGLSGSSKTFYFELSADDSATMHGDDETLEPDSWQFQMLRFDENHIGSVALHCREQKRLLSKRVLKPWQLA